MNYIYASKICPKMSEKSIKEFFEQYGVVALCRVVDSPVLEKPKEGIKFFSGPYDNPSKMAFIHMPNFDEAQNAVVQTKEKDFSCSMTSMKRVYFEVGRLCTVMPHEKLEGEVKEFFEQFGQVEKIKLVDGRGFGHLEMHNENEAQNAIIAFQQKGFVCSPIALRS